MKNEHVVWLIVAKDREGRARGMEKVLDGRFYLIEGEAHATLANLEDNMRGFFKVAEARISFPEEPAA